MRFLAGSTVGADYMRAPRRGRCVLRRNSRMQARDARCWRELQKAAETQPNSARIAPMPSLPGSNTSSTTEKWLQPSRIAGDGQTCGQA